MLRKNLSDEAAAAVAGHFDINPETFTTHIKDAARDADSLFLFRHTLMNPWLGDGEEGETYIDKYFAYLEELIVKELHS